MDSNVSVEGVLSFCYIWEIVFMFNNTYCVLTCDYRNMYGTGEIDMNQYVLGLLKKRKSKWA